MTKSVLAPVTARISELKADPMKTFQRGEGQPVAIMDGNQAAFYVVPPDIYEQWVEMADDQELNAVADVRLSDGREPVQVLPRDL